MVQSNYTVSTAHQLLGGMQPVRAPGSKSKSSTSNKSATATASEKHVKLADNIIRAPPPTGPLPPTPYDLKKVPVLDTPRKGKEPAVIEKRISQYYEYITPPVSLGIGRSGSRRERKASHTPTSSAGSDIYFSPIDASRSQVFLSSPQPSPPITPTVVDKQETPKPAQVEEVADRFESLVIETSSAKQMVEIAGIGRSIDNRRLTLTLAHVDRISTALALAPLVQMRVRGFYLDTLPSNMTATASDKAVETKATSNADTAALPTPPPSEASSIDEVGGIALIDTTIEGAPVTLTSTEAFMPGKCTHLSLPYGLSTTNRLRIEPATTSASESKIILQSLFAALNRKTGVQDLTLLAETDVTHSFARAALTELAHTQNMTLDDLEIRTPTVAYSPDESIDWCNLDQPDNATSPVTDILNETSSAFSSTLSAETCTMQTLTLLSELQRLQKAHSTFLVLQPTRYDARGALAGVKIPLISQALRQRFAKMDTSSATGSSTSSSSSGGLKGRLFREAVIAAVAPRFVREEEFETFVTLEGGEVKVRARCVPLFDAGESIERWVCFLGGEYDVPY